MELHIHNYGTMWVDRDLFQMWLVMTDYYGSETEHQEAMDAAGARWDDLKELFEAGNLNVCATILDGSVLLCSYVSTCVIVPIKKLSACLECPDVSAQKK